MYIYIYLTFTENFIVLLLIDTFFLYGRPDQNIYLPNLLSLKVLTSGFLSTKVKLKFE